MAENGARGSRQTNFWNVGTQGRKTGITVEDTGKRDAHGFEDMDNFFSPEKAELPPPPAPKPAPAAGGGIFRGHSAVPSSTGNEKTATEGSMAVAESSGLEPKEARAFQMRQASLPPYISRSPGNFTVSGSPRRGSSIGPRSSPTRQLDSSPIRSSSPNKKLDFGVAKRAASVSSVLGSPIRTMIAPPKANGRATSVGPAVPEKQEMSKPREREMSNPPREHERYVAPVAMMATNSQPSKRPPVVEMIAEEDEMKTEDSEVMQSSPVQKKKPAKRGLISAKTVAKPFIFDDDDTEEEEEEEEEDTTNANGDATNGRDSIDEAVSKMLDSTPEPPSRDADVVMSDAPDGDDTQIEDSPAPSPAKPNQRAKARKTPTPEPKPQPTPTPESENEAETEELEPVKLQTKKRPEQKKAAPAPVSELTPEAEEEEEDSDSGPDVIEPKAFQKRAPAKKPAPAKAKKAPEPEPESEPMEEEEEEVDEDDLEPKKFSFSKRPAVKPAAAKGRKAQPRPELEAEEKVQEPVTLKFKNRTAKAKPVKEAAPVSEAESEVEEEEQEMTTSKKRPNGKFASGRGKKPVSQPEPEPEAEEEEEAEVVVPTKKQSKPRKKLTMKTSSRATKKAVSQPAPKQEAEEEGEAPPVPPIARRGGKAPKKVPTPESEEEDEPAPKPAKPTPKGKGRGKAKVVEEELKSESTKPAAKAKGRGKKVVEEHEPEPELEKPVPKAKGKGKAPKAPEPELSESSSQSARRSSTAKAKPKDVPQDDEEPPKKKARSRGKAPKLTMPSRVSPQRRSNVPARKPVPAPEEDEQEPMDVDEPEVDEEPAPPPRKGKVKGKAPAAVAKKTAPAEAHGSPTAKETRGTQRIIREKPPPAPRQQSADEEGSRRSGRARVAPLQYWKGEKAEYALADIDEEEDPRKKTMRMPQLVGVVRIESDEEQKPKRRAPAPKKKAPSAGTKRKRVPDGEGSDDDSDPGEPDVWEHSGNNDEVGVKKGIVRAFPTVVDDDGEEQMEEAQLAFSRNRMVTVDVANGEFKFVKTFTEDHFGTGIIEIPPGGAKRLKNSGKMHLVFYMLKGRATVTISKNNFRVGKGGQFMVPRGNLYSIENEYDKPAKMFFAQGCEPVVYFEDGDSSD